MLRAVDFGESDRIVRLLTPGTARLTVMAKGARRSKKRFPGTIDLFNHLAVQVEQRRPTSMARLEHTRLIDPLEGLRRRPGRFALACTCVELVDRLAPEGVGGRESRRLFDVTLAALRAIASRAADARLQVLLELRLLEALGLRPELGRCVRCARALGDEARLRFHVGEGGGDTAAFPETGSTKRTWPLIPTPRLPPRSAWRSSSPCARGAVSSSSRARSTAASTASGTTGPWASSSRTT